MSANHLIHPTTSLLNITLRNIVHRPTKSNIAMITFTTSPLPTNSPLSHTIKQLTLLPLLLHYYPLPIRKFFLWDDRFGYHMAYFWVHSLACWRYLELSFLKSFAISGTSGSSGLGSQSREQMDNRTLEMVRAGDHCDLKMSKQMLPLLLMLGW